MFYKLVLLLLLLTNNFLASTIILNENSAKVDDFRLDYLYSEKPTITIDEIIKRDFTQTVPNQFSKGYKNGTSWFKVVLENRSNRSDYILYLSEPFWQEVNLYRYNKKRQEWEVEKNGLDVPLKNRDVKDIYPSFEINLDSNSSETFYIEGKSISAHIGEFILFSKDEYNRPSRISIAQFYMIYSIVLLTVVLIISILFFMIKEKLYLFYIGYVFSFIAWLSILSGNYVYFGFPNWNEGLHSSGTLIITFLILFTTEYLELKKLLPIIYKLFYSFAIVIFLTGILIAIDVPYMSLFFNITSTLFFLLLFCVVVYIMIQRNFEGIIIYFIALMMYMISMGLMTLNFNGFLENSFITRYAYIYGSLVEVIFFTYVLAYRFNKVRMDTLKLQGELIKEKSSQEEILKQEVESRTRKLVVVNKELKEQKNKLIFTQEKLLKQSITDNLSNLYNRHYFNEVSKMIYSSAQRSLENLSVLMLDIDKFKNINDTYGHFVGDKVIIRCSAILKEVARESDVVIRYGGEEFLILLPKTDIEDALNVAHRIKDSIEETVVKVDDSNEKNETPVKFTLSIGVSKLLFEDDNSIEQIIKRADTALYEAKKNGRNRVES